MTDLLTEVSKIIEEFRKRGPMLTEIWFIDYPGEYQVFMAEFQDFFVQSPTRYALVSGVRVFSTNSADMLKLPQERRLAARMFQLIPGIWLFMSDGTVREYSNDNMQKFFPGVNHD